MIALDITGRTVRTLVAALKAALPILYTVDRDERDGSGRKIASGLCFCRVKTEGYSSTKNAVTLR